MEIPRQGKDYFTVKRGDTRIRLKGPAAGKTFDIENADLSKATKWSTASCGRPKTSAATTL